MFQKEVAERIVAAPGTGAYGRLAILAQWRADARIVLTLPPEAFVPAPKVSSAVVHLVARSAPRFPRPAETLSRVVAMAFKPARKMLRAALAALGRRLSRRCWQSPASPPTERAEQVGLEGVLCAGPRGGRTAG